MNKYVKYAFIIAGGLTKLFGVPQTAHCPTPPENFKKEYINDIHYNTINLKRDYHLYNPCKED